MEALLKSKFPDTSQGPILQAGLSKASNLSAAVGLICALPMWTHFLQHLSINDRMYAFTCISLCPTLRDDVNPQIRYIFPFKEASGEGQYCEISY